MKINPIPKVSKLLPDCVVYDAISQDKVIAKILFKITSDGQIPIYIEMMDPNINKDEVIDLIKKSLSNVIIN